MWWGLSACGFALIAVVALRNNLVQGAALLALAAFVVITAVFYDRWMRRH